MPEEFMTNYHKMFIFTFEKYILGEIKYQKKPFTSFYSKNRELDRENKLDTRIVSKDIR